MKNVVAHNFRFMLRPSSCTTLYTLFIFRALQKFTETITPLDVWSLYIKNMRAMNNVDTCSRKKRKPTNRSTVNARNQKKINENEMNENWKAKIWVVNPTTYAKKKSCEVRCEHSEWVFNLKLHNKFEIGRDGSIMLAKNLKFVHFCISKIGILGLGLPPPSPISE